MVVHTSINSPTIHAQFMSPHFENNTHFSNNTKVERIHCSDSHRNQFHGLKHQSRVLVLRKKVIN